VAAVVAGVALVVQTALVLLWATGVVRLPI
jgi:hypothetical protein